jgi:hypothetical protein
MEIDFCKAFEAFALIAKHSNTLLGEIRNTQNKKNDRNSD